MADREFHVLVERELSGWVKVTAAGPREAYEKAYEIPSSELPVARTRRFCRRAQPTEPVMKYGRVRVLTASRTCGPDPKMLLYLDCGHSTYVDLDLWYPSNPWVDCANTRCPSHA